MFVCCKNRKVTSLILLSPMEAPGKLFFNNTSCCLCIVKHKGHFIFGQVQWKCQSQIVFLPTLVVLFIYKNGKVTHVNIYLYWGLLGARQEDITSLLIIEKFLVLAFV